MGEHNPLLTDEERALSDDHLYHRLWTWAVGLPGYRKPLWSEFYTRLLRTGRLVGSRCPDCGLPRSVNPHPEAGKPEHFIEVNTREVCIPCLTLNRHRWADRAMKAENAATDLREANARLRRALREQERRSVESARAAGLTGPDLEP